MITLLHLLMMQMLKLLLAQVLMLLVMLNRADHRLVGMNRRRRSMTSLLLLLLLLLRMLLKSRRRCVSRNLRSRRPGRSVVSTIVSIRSIAVSAHLRHLSVVRGCALLLHCNLVRLIVHDLVLRTRCRHMSLCDVHMRWHSLRLLLH